MSSSAWGNIQVCNFVLLFLRTKNIAIESFLKKNGVMVHNTLNFNKGTKILNKNLKNGGFITW